MLNILTDQLIGIKEKTGGCFEMDAVLDEIDSLFFFIPLKGCLIKVKFKAFVHFCSPFPKTIICQRISICNTFCNTLIGKIEVER